MSDYETDDQLAYRLGVTLGMDYALPLTHRLVKRPTDPIIRTTTPRPGSWARDHFIEKDNNTMTTTDQTGQFRLDWDPAPAARRTDLSTSHRAAASVNDAKGIRARVWIILRANPDGLTHEQLIEAYRMNVDDYGWAPAAPQSIRSRTKELERDGMVRHNEHPTDKTKAGRLTHRWFAVTDPNEQKRRREGMSAAQGPSPERTADLVGDLANDIQESRRVGSFMAREMAQYLVDKGWTRTPQVTAE